MAINRAAMKAIPIEAYLKFKNIDYTDHSTHTVELVDDPSWVVDLRKNTFQEYADRSIHGDLGDFIENWFQIDKKAAWKEWAAFSRVYSNLDESQKASYSAPAPQEKREFNFDRWKTSRTTDNTRNYLTEVRGFHPKFINQLIQSNLIMEGTPRRDKETQQMMKPSIFFPWLNEESKIVGLDLQGTDVDFEKFGKRGTEKKTGYSSNTDYGFNFRFGNGADKLILFEAPIDALSYTQQNLGTLMNENATIYSLSGVNAEKALKQLIRMDEQYGSFPKKMIIASDNDFAGYRLANELDRNYTGKDMEVTRQIPVHGKDWNDQLKAGVLGIEEFSLDENYRRMEALEKLKDLKGATIPSKGNNVVDLTTRNRTIKDEKSVGTNGRSTKSHISRKERDLANRIQNEAIISEALKNAQKSFNSPDDIKRYLNFTASGMNYSPRNTMMIFGQRENASIVMGYEQFQQRGIQVLHEQAKGQGIKLFGAPKEMKTLITEDGEVVNWANATKMQKDAANEGTLQTKVAKHYPIETVFDVTQTNAKMTDLQKLLPKRPINLSSDKSPQHLENAYGVLKTYAAKQGYRVEDANEQARTFLKTNSDRPGTLKIDGVANGLTYSDDKNPQNNMIILRPDLSREDKIVTLANELGRASLHNSTVQNSSRSNNVRELQAQMTSYVVLKNIGVDPEKLDSNFTADWNKGIEQLPKDVEGRTKALLEVTRASSDVTNFLSDRLSNGEEKKYDTLSSKSAKNSAVNRNQDQLLQDQSEGQTRTR